MLSRGKGGGESMSCCSSLFCCMLCIDPVGDLVFGDGSEEQALVLLYLVSQDYC